MKRSEIIKQLMNEGFSEKTLVNFSDKQLVSLSSRILSEQINNSTGTKNIKSTNKPAIDDAKSKGETFSTYEEGAMPGLKAKKEVKESGVPGLKAKSSGKLGHGTAQKEMKEAGVPGLTAKKSSGELKNGTAQKEMKEAGVPGLKAKSSGKLGHGTAQKEMKEAAGAMPGLTVKGTTATPTTKSTSKKETKEEVTEKKPSAGLSKEKKSEVVKKAKAGGDIGKKGKGFKKVVATAKKGGAKDPEAVAAAAMWKNIKREGKQINEFVEGAVKKVYHPFTSKNDIMEMIMTKLEEVSMDNDERNVPDFMTAKSIKAAGAPAPAKPKTTPTTKPGTTPGKRPVKTPYKTPGVSPHPKAGIRAEEEEISEAPKTNNVPVVKPGSKI